MPLFAEEAPGSDVDRGSVLSQNPFDISNQLSSDKEGQEESTFRLPRFDALFQPWYDMKERMDRDLGIQFGLAWTALGQAATSGPGERSAAGGIAELFGTGALPGRHTVHPGTLGFDLDSSVR